MQQPPALLGRSLSSGYLAPDSWSPLADKLRYNDQGPPDLDKFFAALGLEWQQGQPKGKKS